MFKDFKQLGYFDELRKDVLEAWMKSQHGMALEEQIKEIISSQTDHVASAQFSTTLVEAEEEKARITLLIRDKINESGVLKSLPRKLLDFVNSEEWKDRISKDLDSMKLAIGIIFLDSKMKTIKKFKQLLQDQKILTITVAMT